MVWPRQVDAEPGEGVGKRGDQPVGREHGVEVRGAKEARQIGAAKLPQRGQSRAPQLGIGDRRVGILRGLEEGGGLARQRLEVDPAKLGVGGGIARPAQRPAELVGALERRAVERVQPLAEDGVARLLERRPALRLRLVGLLDRHRAIRDRPVARVDLQRGLEPGQLRRLGPGLEAQQPVERELEQVAKAALLVVAGGGAAELPQPLHVRAREQVGVVTVDGLDLELEQHLRVEHVHNNTYCCHAADLQRRIEAQAVPRSEPRSPARSARNLGE